jgi:hypothetical protein
MKVLSLLLAVSLSLFLMSCGRYGPPARAGAPAAPPSTRRCENPPCPGAESAPETPSQTETQPAEEP